MQGPIVVPSAGGGGGAAVGATLPLDVTTTAASAGVSAEASRVDHKHDVADSVVYNLAWYGTGVDGATNMNGANTFATFASKAGSVYTLTRDIYPTTLTLPSGSTLNSANFRVQCSVLCDIQLGGIIQNNGGDGAALGTAGIAVASQTLVAGAGTGGAGGTAAGAAGSAVSNSVVAGVGGAGGAGSGGAGSVGVTTGAPNASNGSVVAVYAPTVMWGGAFSTRSGVTTGWNTAGGGGGGGGDGTAGGGGGAGAGAIVIFARSIIVAGTLQCKGGAGGTPAAGNRGGGGGGSGGLIGLVYNAITETGTISVAGGAAGSLAGTGTNGTAGATGLIIRLANAA